MKRFLRLITAVFAAAVFALNAAAADIAHYQQDISADSWNGAGVTVDAAHSVISANAGGAYIEFDADGYSAVLLYFDAGNYSGKSAGSVALVFLGADGAVLQEEETKITVDGNFHRYSYGSDKLYAELPENTAKVRLTLYSDGSGNSNADGPYYKNLTLCMSSTAARTSDMVEWTVSGQTGLVQVNVTKSQYWVLVIFVFLVALVMFAVRKILDKNNKS